MKSHRQKILSITVATSAFFSAWSQAANVAISDASNGGPLTTQLNVATGNWYQPGVGSVSGTLNINSGGSIVVTDAAFASIIQQNAAGTSTINLNPGGSWNFAAATGGGKSLWLGNNVATAIAIINVQGGVLDGSGMNDIIFGRDGGTGQMNISAGSVVLGDSTPLFDATNAGAPFGTNNNSYINFPANSTGTLSVTDANQAFYQALWDSQDLRYDGANTGLFTDHFQVSGNVLSLAKDPDPSYLAWAELNELTEPDNALDADPDHDGLSNLAEFAFDGDPLSSTNDGRVVTKVVTLGADRILTLTLPMRLGADFSAPTSTEMVSDSTDGIVYHIQGSTDLSAYGLAVAEITGLDATAIQDGLNLPLLSDDEKWSYRTFRAPGVVSPSAPKQFLRAKVVSP